MADPTQFGNKPNTNMWAWLKNLNTKHIGIHTFAGVPVDGPSGTYGGYCAPGCVIIDTNTGIWYVNAGTLASPSYRATSVISGNAGLGALGNAKMTYDFTVDGGAIATITPVNSPTIPLGAIIIGGTVDITTQVTSGGAATIALGLGSGAQNAALKGATAVASFTVGQMAIIPVFTAATYVKAAAAAQLTLTVAAFTLTAGRFDLNVVYMQGNT